VQFLRQRQKDLDLLAFHVLPALGLVPLTSPLTSNDEPGESIVAQIVLVAQVPRFDAGQARSHTKGHP
jgi:hypothetical protein